MNIRLSVQDYFWIALIYSFAWFGLLLNTEYIYWDDWAFVGLSNNERLTLWSMTGMPIKAYLHNFLLQVGNGIWIYRLLTYLTYLFSSFLFLWIIRQIPGVSYSLTFWATAIFATYPANQARISLINFPYGLTVLAFLLATSLLIVSYRKRSRLLRISAIILFLFSFSTKSLLVFYIAPIIIFLTIAHNNWWRGWNPQTIQCLVKLLLRNFDLLIIPVIFYLGTNYFYKPSGLYEGYNSVSMASVPSALLSSIRSILNLSWLPVMRIFPNATYRHIFALAALIIISTVLVRSVILKHRSGHLYSQNLCLIVAAIGLLFLSIFPYHVVGKTPANLDWTTRHQLLIPFGASLLITYLICQIFEAKKAKLLLCMVVFFSILTINRDLLWYYVDGIKQKALVSELRSNSEIRNIHNKVIFFEDNAKELNAMHRFYRYYELNAFMNLAYSDSTRFGSLSNYSDHWTLEKLTKLSKYKQYNFEEFSATTLEHAGTAIILPGSFWPNNVVSQLKLFFDSKRGVRSITDQIDNMIDIEFTPSDPLSRR